MYLYVCVCVCIDLTTSPDQPILIVKYIAIPKPHRQVRQTTTCLQNQSYIRVWQTCRQFEPERLKRSRKKSWTSKS